MESLTLAAQELLAATEKKYQERLAWDSQPKIYSRETISFFAFLYEKLRNFVDYQEEHLLRRRAIKRSLTRRLLFPQPSEEMARGLILEMIHARYLLNNFLPEIKIQTTAKIIEKYLNLSSLLPELKDLLISCLSREIEEDLTLDNELPLLLFCQKILREKYLVKDDWLLFIALEEALSKADESTIRYHLLKMSLADWRPEEVRQINQRISHKLTLPEREALARRLRKEIAPFVILRDLINQNQANLFQIFSDSNLFEKMIKEVAGGRYRQAAANLRTAAVQSFIYIFLTKMVFAFLIEVPYDLYVIGRLNPLPLVINLLFPPFFMLITTQTVSLPGQTNTQRISQELKKAVYLQPGIKIPAVLIDFLAPVRPFLNLTFTVLYLLTFTLVFGGVFLVLSRLKFSLASIAVFFFFVSTIAFFAFRIRRNFADLTITPQKEGLLGGLFNFVSYPFIKLGHLFSRALSQFNIFVVILDLIIEAPIKLLLELVEEWFAFIRQKQEEIL